MLFIQVNFEASVDSTLINMAGSNLNRPFKPFSIASDVGVLAQYTIISHIAVGATFVFGKLFGATGVTGVASPDASHTVQLATGADFRTVQLWLNYSM
jgi:hypothetical protein